MDRQLRGYYGSVNKIKFDEENVSILSNDIFIPNSFNLPPLPNSGMTVEGDSHEDCDFSDVDFKYISQMLMEEDMEEKTCMFQDSAALQSAERSFYEVLGEKYPPSPDQSIESPNECYSGITFSKSNSNTSSSTNSCSVIESPNECHSGITFSNSNTSSSTNSCCVINPCLNCDRSEYESLPLQSFAMNVASQATSWSSFGSSSSAGNVIDGLVDSPMSTLRVPDIFNDSLSVLQFKKGVEEANSFLPRVNGLCLDSGINLVTEAKEEKKDVVVKVEKKYEIEYPLDVSRGKKNTHPEQLDLEEGRSNKQSALYAETTIRSEMFDLVLLCNGGKSESALREAMQNVVNKNMQQNAQPKGSNGSKARGKKQIRKRDVVDLRTLLTICAQSVATDDQRTANELLKQIRQHASPIGDGMQRMAHYFADGLDARMSGSGAQSYKAVITKPTSAAELASRPGGPPRLRITGIDFPNSGFRPAERVEETGHRLADYAKSFNVPFEFNAIAKKWEAIQIDDLKLDWDELLVVNCQYRLRNLLDETVVVESPRDMVLNLIKKMNPDVFLQGVVSASYNAPFFITRFREALFHFSSLFDMLEANVPNEIHERILIEKQIFGWEAVNVIACEGAERIERPETFKQWQARNMRAGFRQLPLDEEIMNKAKERVRTCYHKDFVIDRDGNWMLLGWKGRLMYGLSSWKPVY